MSGGIIQGVAGKGGLTSYSFDGNDDYVAADSAASNGLKDLASGAFSCSLWFKTQESGFIIEKREQGGDKSRSMDISVSNGKLSFPRSTENSIVSSSNIDDGKWHQAVFVYDGASAIRMYIDGSQENAGDIDGSFGVANNNLKIGSRTQDSGGLGGLFKGSLCGFRIYDRALTSKEVQTLYNWSDGDFARPLNDRNSSSAVSRWAFDGNADDSWDSYSSSDETSSGYETGIRGQAKVFDSAQNDYVGVNSGNSLSEDFSSTGITVSGWVKTSSTGARKTIWAGNGANAWWDTRVNENERPEFWYANSGQNSHITASQTVENSEWYHLAFVCRPSDYRLNIYMNGSEVASGGNGNTPNTKQFSKTSIGDRSGDEYMDGSLDDVRIYDKALSPSEVFELYRWGTRGRDLRKLTVNSR